MGKIKNLEKKAKPATEFDKKKPEDRVKSIKDVKQAKKEKVQKKTKVIAKDTGKIQKSKDVKKKTKKVKILKQIEQEVEANANKVEESGDISDKLVKREVVKKAIIAVKDGLKKEAESNTAKNLFDDELRIGLLVVAIKIPDCPKHVKKILLEHSFYDETPDICFIIKDQIPKKGDQEENIREFKEKLKEAGVDYIKNILSMTQLKQDYTTHDLKKKLCNTYDVFLVESEIAEHAYTVLGKAFISKRKRPIQVDTKKTSLLKTMIDNALKKVSFNLNANSNISSFEVATIKMDNVKIADNVMTAIDQLKEKWPGSWKNINRLFIKPIRPSKVSIPIYYSKIDPNDVKIPVIKGAKQNRLDKLAAELKKKSLKMKLDLKKKKIVRKDSDKKPAIEKKKNDATVVVVPTEEKKSEPATAQEETKKKKKRKNQEETSAAIEVETNDSVEPTKKKKKNQEVLAEKTTAVIETSEPSKKKKKKNVKLESNNADVINESVVEQPELETKKKIKNNKKAKSVVKDTINDSTEVKAEKEQISVKKNKKKDKKNKA